MKAPSFAPLHREPRWLSALDVREVVLRVILGEVEDPPQPNDTERKALAWDVTSALDKLEQERGVAPGGTLNA